MVIRYLILSGMELLTSLVVIRLDESALEGMRELESWRIVIHRPLYRALYRARTLAQLVMETGVMSGRAGLKLQEGGFPIWTSHVMSD